MSHREFVLRTEWLDEEWNQPDRTDHYLMRIAQMLSTGEGSRDLDRFKIKFGRIEPRRSAVTSTEAAKAVWRARLGIKRPKEEPTDD